MSEKNEINTEEVKIKIKKAKVRKKKKDKIFSRTCNICKKNLEIICREGEHLIIGEAKEKEKAFALMLGYTICPCCKKYYLLKHREDNLHEID